MNGMEESFDLIFLDILTQFDRPDAALELLDLSIRRLRPKRAEKWLVPSVTAPRRAA